MSNGFPRVMPYFCGYCHKPCEGKWQDFGNGPYEFWGQRGVDVNWQFVSDCCEDSLFYDAELTEEVTDMPSPY